MCGPKPAKVTGRAMHTVGYASGPQPLWIGLGAPALWSRCWLPWTIMTAGNASRPHQLLLWGSLETSGSRARSPA
jgi:hypothetical protein